jgi:hypothetical protein
MFCKTIKGKLKALLGDFDHFIDGHIDTALMVTTGIKQALSSPVADLITSLIPGNLDNVIKDRLVSALDKAIDALTIVDQCKQYTNVNDKLKCFISQLQQRDPHLQDALLLKLASLLVSELDGQKLKQTLYDLYTQAKYATTKQ